ncbi:sodium-dependent transporter [Faecalicatena contorta]|uniref:Neurotransmitter:Na+ symporter, NSS family n=1 Tax=Faecalicatena contorta TaxID=39482 RepID=A0A315ZU73_9FIRM|nr:sodium-dependent transporter [Faecalicatena contorta]PWJ48889.1 NSS family neurotransmitter:Na+ symporter [Faecalicatena contorta]SUQ14979.1 neurotransmitter:Na+ symporter, NSS family [Faecalicatena contorta]
MSKKEHPQWKSRFGYIMVAAGAAIGLGNIWRFPYLAYAGGGGIFILLYLILAVIMGHPMVEMESAIGRYGRGNVAASFGAVNKKYSFIGIIAIVCTVLIDIYYVVVSGWVLKYTVAYVSGADFGVDTKKYFDGFVSSSVEPIVYTAIVVIITAFLLFFGITNLVEKVTKFIMPALFILLIICGIWAIFSTEGAVEGLKYYLLPDFSKLSVKVFADAATQILFSVGIGWGIFITLGASLPKENNIKKDAMWITLCDTSVALIAGFVIIPSAFGAGVDVASGPSLIFVVMTQIFDNLPGGRIIGLCFFIAIVFAVFSTLFTIFEIPVKWVEERFKMKHKVATVVVSGIIFLASIFVSLGFGVLKDFTLPWIDANGLAAYNLYDWLDTATAYVLLPLGCILTCFYVVRVWGIDAYEKELSAGGIKVKLSAFHRMLARIVIPVLMIIVILNCFGFIR